MANESNVSELPALLGLISSDITLAVETGEPSDLEAVARWLQFAKPLADALDEPTRTDVRAILHQVEQRCVVASRTGGIRLEMEKAERRCCPTLDDLCSRFVVESQTKPLIYGIVVDEKRHTVQRQGFDNVVELSKLSWHIFSVALASVPYAATVEAMQDAYPGELDARHSATQELNKHIKRLGLKVDRRKLGET